MFWNPGSQLAPRVHYILTNISKNSSWLTSLGQTYLSLGVGRGWRRGGSVLSAIEKSQWKFWHSATFPRFGRPSQWRGEKWESGCVRRQEGNNQWRSPPCFSQDGGATYVLLDGERPIRALHLIALKTGGQSRARLQLSIKPISRVGGALVRL